MRRPKWAVWSFGRISELLSFADTREEAERIAATFRGYPHRAGERIEVRPN